MEDNGRMNEPTIEGEVLHQDSDWRAVAAPWNDLYEISRSGEVRRVGGELLRAYLNKKTGYKYVGFWRNFNDMGGRQRQTMSVHRLMAIAWMPNPLGLPCVDHLNRDRADYRLCNLEWVTHKTNIGRAAAKGVYKGKHLGEDSGRAKLTEEKVLAIRARYPEETAKQLATAFGVSHTSILNVVFGKTWRHVGGFKEGLKRRHWKAWYSSFQRDEIKQ